MNISTLNVGGSAYDISVSYPNITYSIDTITGSSFTSLDATTHPLYILTANGNVTNIYFASGKEPTEGHSCHVIVKSDGTTERTVTLSSGIHNSINYICPTTDGVGGSTVTNGISSTYFEVDFFRADSTTIYVRGV